MTFEEFVPTVDNATAPVHLPMRQDSEEALRKSLRYFVPRRLLVRRDEYAFYDGAFHSDPLMDAMLRLGPKGPHVALVAKGSEVVGFDHSGLLYLNKEHHGRGLGTELMVQLFLLNGAEVWCSRRREFTPMGMAAARRAYDELKRRGHI
jgi:hypothetical protein